MDGVLGPALDSVLPKPVLGFRRHGGKAGQFRVRLIVAGKEGHRDVVVPARPSDFIGAIGPIAPPAQQPDHHQPGMGDDLFHIEIDGGLVAEVEQAGEPERRKVLIGDLPPGLGQRRQFRVGRRQHHDVARGLAQVDPMAAIVDGAGLGDKQMHGGPLLIPRRPGGGYGGGLGGGHGGGGDFHGASSFNTWGSPAVTTTTLWAASATAWFMRPAWSI